MIDASRQRSDMEDSLRRTADALFEGGAHVSSIHLAELGWWELFSEFPEIAVSVLLEAQGRHLGASRLVEHCAVEIPTELPVALPILGGRGVLFADGTETFPDYIPVKGIDNGSGWSQISKAPPLTERQAALANRAISHEIVGISLAMLDLAVTHSLTRYQFGVAIGSFQAAQHRLADVRVAIDSARAVLRTAWVEDDFWTCSAARTAANEAFEIATANCGQVLGAIGCTWEFPFHRYVRRGILLSILDLRQSVVANALPATFSEVLA